MKALVTGGGGFLGSHIARMLHERGDHVVVLGRNRYPHHERAGIPAIQMDLRRPDGLATALGGFDVVFHTAALPAIWGKWRVFWEANVECTRHVLDACREAGVRHLVYTSSPSVVFDADELLGVDESQPYSRRYLAHYPKTKAVAERLVLEANGAVLATTAIRPHLIWGPGDPNLIPRVIERAKAGKLTQVGDGTNLVDITYIDNAAEAHLLAADALMNGRPCSGRAYFISQGEPVRLWAFLREILDKIGAPSVRKTISYASARRMGTLLEWFHRLTGSSVEPSMTRFLASQLAKSRYFNIEAARRDLGYEPRVSTTEGIKRLVKHLTAPSETS